MVQLASEEALAAQRSLGVWPQRSLHERDASPLEAAFAIERQLGGAISSGTLEGLSVLLEKATSLLSAPGADTLSRSVCAANAAHILVLQNHHQKALDLLMDVRDSSTSYGKSLHYKKHLLHALAWCGLDNTNNERSALLDVVNSYARLPIPSEVEATTWLKLSYDRLHALYPQATISDLESLFTHKNYVISYLNHLPSRGLSSGATAEDLQAYIVKRADILISSTKFPRANERNNAELEELIGLASASGVVLGPLKRELIERAITKTYQSQIILKALIELLLEEKKQEESKPKRPEVLRGRRQDEGKEEINAAVEVYDSYVLAYYEQNHHQYEDIISVIQLNKLLLDSRLFDTYPLEGAEFQYYKERVEKLEKLLDVLYSDQDIDKETEFDVAELLSEGSETNVDEALSIVLAGAWSTVAEMKWRLIESEEFSITTDSAAPGRALQDCRHSLWLSIDDRTAFQYAKCSAVSRNIDDSFSVLKVLLQRLSKTSLVYFQSWHLLALTLSVEENKDEAFKVVGFLVSEVSDFISMGPVEVSFRDVFVEIKITQLAIIQALLGAEQALESLSELFELFHSLFADSIVDEEMPTSKESYHDKTHKRSVSLVRTQTLQKIKSTLHKDFKPHLTTLTPSQIFVDAKATFVKRTLQRIWLCASQIYLQSGLLKEAEEAIVESEKSYLPTADSHVALALLASKQRPQLSMKEFDAALSIEMLHIHSIVGYANLVLTNDSTAFISEKDNLAAIARVKILLESVSETFHGAHTAEVWWLLSQIYEKYDDTRLKKALWRCVELEETRPVRFFGIV